jgi:putative molybdopterin biosynthesis protein
MDTALLTVDEVREKLRLTRYYFDILLGTGRLPHTRVGKLIRVFQDDLDRYMAEEKSLMLTAEDFISGAAILGGQDSSLDLFAERLSGAHIPALRSTAGCYDCLFDLYHRRISMVVVNLWDVVTGEYNYPFIKCLLPGIPVGALRLMGRMQGLYVQAGNPLDLQGWAGFSRRELRMVNREKGSGERILFDQKLPSLGIGPGEIQGYGLEAAAKSAAVRAVAMGHADVGYGSDRGADNVSGVDFIPLQREWYDLVFRLEDRDSPAVLAVLSYVASGEFKADMEFHEPCDMSQLGAYREIGTGCF